MLRINSFHVTAMFSACESWLDIQNGMKEEHLQSLNEAVAQQRYDDVSKVAGELTQMACDIANVVALKLWMMELKQEHFSSPGDCKDIEVAEGMISRAKFPLEGSLEVLVDMMIESSTDPIPKVPEVETHLTLSKQTLCEIRKMVSNNIRTIAAAMEMLMIVRERYINRK